jgi:hypothetical protein
MLSPALMASLALNVMIPGPSVSPCVDAVLTSPPPDG